MPDTKFIPNPYAEALNSLMMQMGFEPDYLSAGVAELSFYIKNNQAEKLSDAERKTIESLQMLLPELVQPAIVFSKAQESGIKLAKHPMESLIAGIEFCKNAILSENVKKSVNCVLGVYQDAWKQWQIADEKKKKELMVPKVEFTSESLGIFYYTNNPLAHALMSLHGKSNEFGNRSVASYGDIHWKLNPLSGRDPISPGWEFAIGLFLRLLAGYDIAPPTSLVKISHVTVEENDVNKTIDGTLQAGLTVKGMSLHRLLDLKQKFYWMYDKLGIFENNQSVFLHYLPNMIDGSLFKDFIKERENKSERELLIELIGVIKTSGQCFKNFNSAELNQDNISAGLWDDFQQMTKDLDKNQIISCLALVSWWPQLMEEQYFSDIAKLPKLFASLNGKDGLFPGKQPQEIYERFNNLLNLLDHYNGTALLLGSWLLINNDWKADNIFVRFKRNTESPNYETESPNYETESPNYEIESLEFVAIDNDKTGGPNISQTKKTAPHYAGYKDVLPFLSVLMQRTLNEKFVAKFLSESPEVILLKWLSILHEQNQRYEHLIRANKLTANDLRENGEPKLDIPICFDPEFVPLLHFRLKTLQALIKKDPKMTHQKLFAEMEPILESFYRAIQEKKQEPLSCMSYLYHGNEGRYSLVLIDILEYYKRLQPQFPLVRQIIPALFPIFTNVLKYFKQKVFGFEKILDYLVGIFPNIEQVLQQQFSTFESVLLCLKDDKQTIESFIKKVQEQFPPTEQNQGWGLEQVLEYYKTQMFDATLNGNYIVTTYLPSLADAALELEQQTPDYKTALQLLSAKDFALLCNRLQDQFPEIKSIFKQQTPTVEEVAQFLEQQIPAKEGLIKYFKAQFSLIEAAVKNFKTKVPAIEEILEDQLDKKIMVRLPNFCGEVSMRQALTLYTKNEFDVEQRRTQSVVDTIEKLIATIDFRNHTAIWELLQLIGSRLKFIGQKSLLIERHKDESKAGLSLLTTDHLDLFLMIAVVGQAHACDLLQKNIWNYANIKKDEYDSFLKSPFSDAMSVIKAVLQLGADINRKNSHGQSVSVLALACGVPIAILETLLSVPSRKCNAIDHDGYSLVFWLNSGQYNEADIDTVLKLLLQYGEDIEFLNTKCQPHQSPLDQAIQNNDYLLFLKLIQHGAGRRVNAQQALDFVNKYLDHCKTHADWNGYLSKFVDARLALLERNSEIAKLILIKTLTTGNVGPIEIEGVYTPRLKINAEISTKLLSAIEGKNRDNKYGRRAVIAIYDIDDPREKKKQEPIAHIKVCPELPGVEALTVKLAEIVMNELSMPNCFAQSELFCLYGADGKRYSVLISPHINGENLQDIANGTDDEVRTFNSTLNMVRFTARTLIENLIPPGDNKFDNAKARKLYNGEYEISGFDVDHAFAEPVVLTNGHRELGVVSALFLLKRMKDRLHGTTSARFVELNVMEILKKWMDALIDWEKRTKNIFSEELIQAMLDEALKEEEKVKAQQAEAKKNIKAVKKKPEDVEANNASQVMPSVLVLPFTQRMLSALKKRFEQMQKYLSEDQNIQAILKKDSCVETLSMPGPDITGSDLLRKVMPMVGIAVDNVTKLNTPLNDQFARLWGNKYEQKSQNGQTVVLTELSFQERQAACFRTKGGPATALQTANIPTAELLANQEKFGAEQAKKNLQTLVDEQKTDVLIFANILSGRMQSMVNASDEARERVLKSICESGVLKTLNEIIESVRSIKTKLNKLERLTEVEARFVLSVVDVGPKLKRSSFLSFGKSKKVADDPLSIIRDKLTIGLDKNETAVVLEKFYNDKNLVSFFCGIQDGKVSQAIVKYVTAKLANSSTTDTAKPELNGNIFDILNVTVKKNILELAADTPLTELSFGKCTSLQYQELMMLLVRVSELRFLDISYCVQFKPKELQEILLKLVEHCPQLEKIMLNGLAVENIGNFEKPLVFSNLLYLEANECSSLKMINLHSPRLKTMEVKKASELMFIGLQGNNLGKLLLTDNPKLTDDCIQTLVSQSPELLKRPKLIATDRRGLRNTVRSMATYNRSDIYTNDNIEFIRDNPMISLLGSGISSKALTMIAPNLSTIKNINLQGTRVGVMGLVELIKHCKEIGKITLSDFERPPTSSTPNQKYTPDRTLKEAEGTDISVLTGDYYGGILVGGQNSTFRLYDALFKLTQTYSADKKFVSALLALPDGSVVKASYDGKIAIYKKYDAKTPARTLIGHRAKVTALKYFSRSNTLVSISDDQSIRFWNLDLDGFSTTLGDGLFKLTALEAMSEDEFVVGDEGGNINLWSLKNQVTVKKNTLYHSSIRALKAVAPYIVAIAGDHYVEDESSAKKCYTIKIFDLRTDKVLRTIEAHEDTITALELLSEGTLLASASEDKTIKIWDLITGERVQTYFGQYSVTGLALTGHNRLVSIDQGGLVHLHKIEPKTIDLDLIHKYFSQGKGKISIMSNLNVIQVNFDPVLIWEEAVLAEFLKQFIDTVLKIIGKTGIKSQTLQNTKTASSAVQFEVSSVEKNNLILGLLKALAHDDSLKPIEHLDLKFISKNSTTTASVANKENVPSKLLQQPSQLPQQPAQLRSSVSMTGLATTAVQQSPSQLPQRPHSVYGLESKPKLPAPNFIQHQNGATPQPVSQQNPVQQQNGYSAIQQQFALQNRSVSTTALVQQQQQNASSQQRPISQQYPVQQTQNGHLQQQYAAVPKQSTIQAPYQNGSTQQPQQYPVQQNSYVQPRPVSQQYSVQQNGYVQPQQSNTANSSSWSPTVFPQYVQPVQQSLSIKPSPLTQVVSSLPVQGF